MTTCRPRRLAGLSLALLTAVAVASAGCTADKPGAAKSTGTGHATSTPAANSTFAGLYLTGDVTVTATTPDRWDLVSSLKCSDLDAMLSAGQWQVVDRLAYPPNVPTGFLGGFGMPPGLLLRRGDALAFAVLSGGDTSCSAALIKLTKQAVTVSGDGLPGTSQGWVATTSCLRDDKSLSVSLYFDTDSKVGGIVRLELTAGGGSYTVNAQDSTGFSVSLAQHKSHLLETLTKALPSATDPTAMALPDAKMYDLQPGENFKGTAAVEGAGSDTPHGTVKLEGLEPDSDSDSGSGSGPIQVTVPFACTKVAKV